MFVKCLAPCVGPYKGYSMQKLVAFDTCEREVCLASPLRCWVAASLTLTVRVRCVLRSRRSSSSTSRTSSGRRRPPRPPRRSERERTHAAGFLQPAHLQALRPSHECLLVLVS